LEVHAKALYQKRLGEPWRVGRGAVESHAARSQNMRHVIRWLMRINDLVLHGKRLHCYRRTDLVLHTKAGHE
jgi:hypothetical protein